MECHVCGHSTADAAARFCAHCGSELVFSEEEFDPIAAINEAVEAFEAGELQSALDILDEQLDSAEEAKDEVTLIYLLDVSRQMVRQLDEGEFENLEQLVSDAKGALRSVQQGALPPPLVLAHERFSEGNHQEAWELLSRVLAEAPTDNEATARLTLWRIFAVTTEMADALDNARASFEQLRLSAERRLAPAGELASFEPTEPDQFEGFDEVDKEEQESVLEPFDTPNPWLQKLFAMPAYGSVPTRALSLLREVSPDHDERLLTAIKVMNGRVRGGYLLATTKWLRWIQIFPMRQEELWSYDYKVEYKGLGLPLTMGVIISASGLQFQSWGSRGKQFVQMYSIIQQAMTWDASSTDQKVAAALSKPGSSPPDSLADELRKLSEMHDRGTLTSEEFAAAKQKLMD
jgi:hypothetical protein